MSPFHKNYPTKTAVSITTILNGQTSPSKRKLKKKSNTEETKTSVKRRRLMNVLSITRAQ